MTCFQLNCAAQNDEKQTELKGEAGEERTGRRGKGWRGRREERRGEKRGEGVERNSPNFSYVKIIFKVNQKMQIVPSSCVAASSVNVEVMALKRVALSEDTIDIVARL